VADGPVRRSFTYVAVVTLLMKVGNVFGARTVCHTAWWS